MAVSVVQGKVVAVLADEKRKGAMNKLNTCGDILVAQNASLPKKIFLQMKICSPQRMHIRNDIGICIVYGMNSLIYSFNI